MQLVSERNGGIIIGQFTGLLGISRGERNAVVDVQNAGCAAGRPDHGGGFDEILFSVDVAVDPLGAGNCAAGCALFPISFRSFFCLEF